MHVIQIAYSVNATQLITIPLQLNRVTSYFYARKPTQEEHEDENILKIELTPPWDPSSPEFTRQEQSMFDYSGWFVSTKGPARG